MVSATQAVAATPPCSAGHYNSIAVFFVALRVHRLAVLEQQSLLLIP